MPIGGKEHNKVVRKEGDRRTFDFSPKNHLELNEKLNWFDFDGGGRLAGSGFVVYQGDGLKMLYALTNLMIKKILNCFKN